MGKRVKKRITNKQIRSAVYKGIKRNADRIFDLSQKDCPVDRGTLKRSGYVRKLKNGAVIGYRAPYAAAVEFGTKAFPIVGDTIIKVKQYFRRRRGKTGKLTKVGGSTVRAHVRKVTDGIIVPTQKRGRKKEFRTIHAIPAKEGRRFLTDNVKIGLKELPRDIAWALEKIKSVGKADPRGGK